MVEPELDNKGHDPVYGLYLVLGWTGTVMLNRSLLKNYVLEYDHVVLKVYI